MMKPLASAERASERTAGGSGNRPYARSGIAPLIHLNALPVAHLNSLPVAVAKSDDPVRTACSSRLLHPWGGRPGRSSGIE